MGTEEIDQWILGRNVTDSTPKRSNSVLRILALSILSILINYISNSTSFPISLCISPQNAYLPLLERQWWPNWWKRSGCFGRKMPRHFVKWWNPFWSIKNRAIVVVCFRKTTLKRVRAQHEPEDIRSFQKFSEVLRTPFWSLKIHAVAVVWFHKTTLRRVRA